MENKHIYSNLNDDYERFNQFIYSNGVDNFELSCILDLGIELKNTDKVIFLEKDRIKCNKLFFDLDNTIFAASEIIFNNTGNEKSRIKFKNKKFIEINDILKYTYVIKNFQLLQEDGVFFFCNKSKGKDKELIFEFNTLLKHRITNGTSIENNIS